jgi:hypothetical protein
MIQNCLTFAIPSIRLCENSRFRWFVISNVVRDLALSAT